MTPPRTASGRPRPDPQALPGRRFAGRPLAAPRRAAGDDDSDDFDFDQFDDFDDDEDDDEIDGEDDAVDYEEEDDEDEFDEPFDDPEEDAYYLRAGRGTRPDCGTRAAPARRTGAALPS